MSEPAAEPGTSLRELAEQTLRAAAESGADILVLSPPCRETGSSFSLSDEAGEWFRTLQNYRARFDRVELAMCGENEAYRRFRVFKHYIEDDVTVIGSSQAAREEFGELYGGFTVRVSKEQIDALQKGKQLAINVNDEYMIFLEGPER